jgi:hypothetical protein
MSGSVIVGGARTPIGKLSGSLKNFSAMDLGGFAIKEAMARAGNAVLQGTSELGNAWMSFWNDQASEGIRTLRALAECRTLQETLEIQNEFARTSLERLCANTTKTAELTAQMVNNGLGSVRARTQRTMQRAA